MDKLLKKKVDTISNICDLYFDGIISHSIDTMSILTDIKRIIESDTEKDINEIASELI